MSGRELARRLRAARPELEVLFLSVYADEALDIQGVLSSGIAPLEKPFSRGELARKIRDVLGTPSQSSVASHQSPVTSCQSFVV
jgi:DNA-binding response OmpR family regulator